MLGVGMFLWEGINTGLTHFFGFYTCCGWLNRFFTDIRGLLVTLYYLFYSTYDSTVMHPLLLYIVANTVGNIPRNRLSACTLFD